MICGQTELAATTSWKLGTILSTSYVCRCDTWLHTGIIHFKEAFVYCTQHPRQRNWTNGLISFAKVGVKTMFSFSQQSLRVVFPPCLPRYLEWKWASKRGAVHCNSYFRPCKVNTTPWGDFLIMNTKEVSALIKLCDDAELLSVIFFFFFFFTLIFLI